MTNNMTNNILIIGGTGFLGRNFIEHTQKHFDNVYATGHSEYKITFFKKRFPNIKLFLVNIDNTTEHSKIDDFIKTNNINYVIHTAAMKHVNICQENIVNTLYTNVIFPQNLVNICKKNKVKNLIAISTDKANNPCNVYGMSKYMMEKIILDNGYKIFQGVNFFWSDGSVLDIWFNQYKMNKPLTYTKLNSYRYYNLIDNVCETIYDGLSTTTTPTHSSQPQPQLIITKSVYKISLADLLTAFTKYFNYTNHTKTDMKEYEKDIEELLTLPNTDIKIITPTIDEIVTLLDNTYKNIICK